MVIAVSDDLPVKVLQAMPVFGGIGKEALRFLLSIAPLREVKRGAYFYREGDTADSMLVLLSGRATMLKTWQGADYQLRTLAPGNNFGEVALIDMNPRNTSVLAVEDCTAVELSAHVLYRLYERDSEQFTLIYMNMAREICRRLREADRRLFEADMQSRRTDRRS